MARSPQSAEGFPTFRHQRIDETPPCGRLGICLPTDLTGSGRPDVIIGGAGRTLPVKLNGSEYEIRNFPGADRLIGRLETNLFWYENPGWTRHKISTTPDLYVFGNALGDVTGDGRLDLAVGQSKGSSDVYWFEQPADPRAPWTRRLVTDAFEKYHDLRFADVDDDGSIELVGTSQVSDVVFYYDVPEDPYQEPWPDSHLHLVAEGINVEGLSVGDIDEDGRTEVLAGATLFHRTDANDGEWQAEELASDWNWTRTAVGDLDDDGQLEIVLSEGDAPEYGGQPGRVGIFDPPDWELTVLRDDFYCPHTLQLADFDGSGTLDIYVAEMGLGTNTNPEHVVFRNLGDGSFEETSIARGVPTHEAKVADLNGNGRPDIIGKSYTPSHHVDAWYNGA